MKTKRLPSPHQGNTIFLPSKRNDSKRTLQYVHNASWKLSNRDVIYFTAIGAATYRVVDAVTVLMKLEPDVRIVHGSIRPFEVPDRFKKGETRIVSKLTVGVSKRDYFEPVLEFLPKEKRDLLF